MARKPRIEYAGAVYHVMARGNRRQNVFEKEEDFRAFLRCLGEACERAGWLVHAYVLMSNHYHLLLETPEANLVTGMKWMQGTFTQRYNRAHRMSGHLFQGRYKALIVDPEQPDYFRRLSAYIHLNPARARIVDVCQGARLSSYPWSSYPAYLKPAKRSSWLEVARVLESLGYSDGVKGRRAYAYELEKQARDVVDPKRNQALEEDARGIRRGWCLGDSTFREQMEALIDGVMAPRKRTSYYGPERRTHDERSAERWMLEALKLVGLKQDELDALPKNDARKVAVAGWLKKRTVVGNARLSEWLSMGHEMNVSRAVKACGDRRFREVNKWTKKLNMLGCAE